MNPFFRQQLATAEKVNGIRFYAIADWDDLLDLHRLAEVVTNADAKGNAALLRPCVEIGGQLFHRVTIGAAEWFKRVAQLYKDDHGERYSMAFAYAFYGSRDPVALLWPYADNRKRLDARLDEWSKGLGCTPSELFDTLTDFAKEEQTEAMPGDEAAEIDDDPKPADYGWVIETLCHEYGGTPEGWIWNTPRAKIDALLRERERRMRAEKTPGRSDPNDPGVKASHRFDQRLKALVAKKKEAANGPKV